MPESLTDLEKQVIAAIQGDMPIVERPYEQMAAQLNIAEDRLLDILNTLIDKGIIRRFGATLRHQQSGYKSNVMVAWQVDEALIEQVGNTMADFKMVSHCYRRNPTGQWPYNLYTMVHGRSEADCRNTVKKMAAESGIDTYTLLFSKRELKKTSMKYFAKAPAENTTAGDGHPG